MNAMRQTFIRLRERLDFRKFPPIAESIRKDEEIKRLRERVGELERFIVLGWGDGNHGA